MFLTFPGPSISGQKGQIKEKNQYIIYISVVYQVFPHLSPSFIWPLGETLEKYGKVGGRLRRQNPFHSIIRRFFHAGREKLQIRGAGPAGVGPDPGNDFRRKREWGRDETGRPNVASLAEQRRRRHIRWRISSPPITSGALPVSESERTKPGRCLWSASVKDLRGFKNHRGLGVPRFPVTVSGFRQWNWDFPSRGCRVQKALKGRHIPAQGQRPGTNGITV